MLKLKSVVLMVLSCFMFSICFADGNCFKATKDYENKRVEADETGDSFRNAQAIVDRLMKTCGIEQLIEKSSREYSIIIADTTKNITECSCFSGCIRAIIEARNNVTEEKKHCNRLNREVEKAFNNMQKFCSR
jgi:hypothetical protein